MGRERGLRQLYPVPLASWVLLSNGGLEVGERHRLHFQPPSRQAVDPVNPDPSLLINILADIEEADLLPSGVPSVETKVPSGTLLQFAVSGTVIPSLGSIGVRLDRDGRPAAMLII
jgi:hypothetical protein